MTFNLGGALRMSVYILAVGGVHVFKIYARLHHPQEECKKYRQCHDG